MDMSILKSIAVIAEKVAPTIASILTGGASTEVTTVISLLSNLFGAQNPEELLQKINADADRDAKLVQFELDYKARIAEIDEKDRESARQMNDAGMKEFLVGFAVIAWVICFIGSFYIKDHEIQHAFGTTFQTLSGILAVVYALYFGTNRQQ